MAKDLIRFQCSCGKRLTANGKHAGRATSCPSCKKTVTVPHVAWPPGPSRAAREPEGSCCHPALDRFYRIVLERFGDRIERHGLEDGRPRVRFLLPRLRGQEVRLDIGKDRKGRDILILSSEVGTVTGFEETVKALQANRSIGRSRMFLDDGNLLALECLLRLSEVDDPEFARVLEEVSQKADEMEELLFGVDIR